jgi:hypothetical protein
LKETPRVLLPSRNLQSGNFKRMSSDHSTAIFRRYLPAADADAEDDVADADADADGAALMVVLMILAMAMAMAAVLRMRKRSNNGMILEKSYPTR